MKQTILNLTKAFIGESQARNRYTYFAKVAQKEGYELVGEVFTLTAEQEKIHAKRLFEHIQELKKKERNLKEIKVEAEAPTIFGTTEENLKAAMAGEHYEYSKMYPEFADIAQKEGFPIIAARMRAIAVAEKHHEDRYKTLLKRIETKEMFKRKKKTVWICRECGFLHEGLEAPKVCPACSHPQAFYQVRNEDY
ncbi:rubrerythrin family protein [Candidatus Beckwithbacteria bacterium]|nr:rubrerythrin family protein [Candidatus Beckwithbacteria bacterium]